MLKLNQEENEGKYMPGIGEDDFVDKISDQQKLVSFAEEISVLMRDL